MGCPPKTPIVKTEMPIANRLNAPVGYANVRADVTAGRLSPAASDERPLYRLP